MENFVEIRVKEKGKRTYKVLHFFGVSKEEAGENGKEKVKGAGIFDPFGRIRVRNCKRRSSRGVFWEAVSKGKSRRRGGTREESFCQGLHCVFVCVCAGKVCLCEGVLELNLATSAGRE